MARVGLVCESLDSGRLVYEADWANPYAAALKQLVSPRPASKTAAPKPEVEARWDAVRTELSVQGAPLWAPRPNRTASRPLEELLAEACELSHLDPSVAKVLPYLFVKKKDELQFDELERALAENKQKHTAGFLLAVASVLSGDRTLRAWAERLKDARRTRLDDFFTGSSSKRLRRLAERNTPALARAWNFRLNMTMSDFRSVMEKFALDAHVPS